MINYSFSQFKEMVLLDDINHIWIFINKLSICGRT
nr:MAG TPA: hypothetical protein [Caudoviricetes sp.]